jgi:hypothetical protein
MIFKMTRVYMIDALDKAGAWKQIHEMKEQDLMGRLEYESMKPAEPETWKDRVGKQIFGKK